ncbi:helix-turn-helix domain-containing protein [Lacticaseibacillus paracasei]|uniref:helix-turn-helix domain-containing protein n=1 Tax=Lacticaseibacillus paracasei TaxID=1597 RepID=UPI00209EFF76|nr:helix-turn-helix transcriptional regulator [Lacticaseibacillus paracasei]UVH22846.1 helix-turn-helix domain-containing protein [Lacticaseibacillus paracasei]
MPKINLSFIKKRRQSLGLNQSEMAKRLGMSSKSNYSRYETGIYTFDSTHVPLLAAALKVSMNSLYTRKVSNLETLSNIPAKREEAVK